MPNTEIEAQYLLEAADAHRRGAGRVRLRSRLDDAGEPARTSSPNTSAVQRAVHARCSTRRGSGRRRCTARRRRRSRAARSRRSRSPTSSRSVMQDLIAVGVKTHFIYHVVAKNNAYKRPLPDVFEDRPGQMDAFGIASGLVAIHTRRPDNSFLEFVRRDNPKSPIFTGFSKANGHARRRARHDRAGDRREGGGRSDLQEHLRRGRRRCRRPSTSRASTGRPSATTPTGMAIRAPRRARSRPARRPPAIRAWSTCAFTSR